MKAVRAPGSMALRDVLGRLVVEDGLGRLIRHNQLVPSEQVPRRVAAPLAPSRALAAPHVAPESVSRPSRASRAPHCLPKMLNAVACDGACVQPTKNVGHEDTSDRACSLLAAVPKPPDRTKSTGDDLAAKLAKRRQWEGGGDSALAAQPAPSKATPAKATSSPFAKPAPAASAPGAVPSSDDLAGKRTSMRQREGGSGSAPAPAPTTALAPAPALSVKTPAVSGRVPPADEFTAKRRNWESGSDGVSREQQATQAGGKEEQESWQPAAVGREGGVGGEGGGGGGGGVRPRRSCRVAQPQAAVAAPAGLPPGAAAPAFSYAPSAAKPGPFSEKEGRFTPPVADRKSLEKCKISEEQMGEEEVRAKGKGKAPAWSCWLPVCAACLVVLSLVVLILLAPQMLSARYLIISSNVTVAIHFQLEMATMLNVPVDVMCANTCRLFETFSFNCASETLAVAQIACMPRFLMESKLRAYTTSVPGGEWRSTSA